MRGGRGGAPLGVAVAGCRELAQPLSRARTHPAGPHDDEDAKLDYLGCGTAVDGTSRRKRARAGTQPAAAAAGEHPLDFRLGTEVGDEALQPPVTPLAHAAGSTAAASARLDPSPSGRGTPGSATRRTPTFVFAKNWGSKAYHVAGMPNSCECEG